MQMSQAALGNNDVCFGQFSEISADTKMNSLVVKTISRLIDFACQTFRSTSFMERNLEKKEQLCCKKLMETGFSDTS